jgi:uncharacterized integral membrane protein
LGGQPFEQDRAGMASTADDPASSHGDQPQRDAGQAEGVETRRQHARRMGSRAKLYASLVLLAALVLVIVLLALDNRNDARLSWVVGNTEAPVVWIVLVAAIVGWLAGIVTGAVVRRRTRAPR